MVKEWKIQDRVQWFKQHPRGRELLKKYNKDDAALIRALYVFPGAYELGQMKWDKWRTPANQ